MAMICIACQLGLIAECYTRPGKGCKKEKQPIVNIIPPSATVADKSDRLTEETMRDMEEKVRKARGHKADTQLVDPTSTGRKRAAVALPTKAFEIDGKIKKYIVDDAGNPIKCEWAGLKFAGGGEFPIIGCDGKIATNRHHGPDKDTTNNRRETPRNIHAICAFCHNRWHSLNDENYEYYLDDVGGPKFLRPHDSQTRATDEEIRANELKYASRRRKAKT
jgi:hypothetical protein